MLDNITKKNIDDCRDVLVGKVPDPKSQIEQITLALIYKFMDDMDQEAVVNFGGKAKFFAPPVYTGDKETDDKLIDYSKYSWRKLFEPSLSGVDMLALYMDALEKLHTNPNIPELFRNIFKNAYLPYRDPATLKLFLKYINAFEYSHSEKLGDAFEYLLSVMGSQGDAGQFRTPRNIIDFVTACVNPQKTETVLDPACGTAGFLLSAYKHIYLQNTRGNTAHNNIYAYNNLPNDKPIERLGTALTPDQRKKVLSNFVGYDISPDMVRLSLANMYLHGFTTPKIYEYDSLSSEDRWNENYDVILANPPFMTPKGGIRPHKKFGVQANKAEVLFTDYIAEHLNPNGRAGIVVPNGIVATSQTAYKQLRQHLVADSLIAVISLPAGCFNPYSGVKTSVLLLDKRLAKKSKHILFIKISNDGFDLGAQRREHDKNDLPAALAIFEAYKQCLQAEATTLQSIADIQTAYDANTANPALQISSLASLVAKATVLKNKDAVLSAERYFEAKEKSTDYEVCKLEDIVLINESSIDPIKAFGIEQFTYIDIESVENGTGVVKLTKVLNPSEAPSRARRKIKDGDVIISTVRPNLKAFAYLENLPKNCLASTGFAVLSENENVLGKYLYYIIKQDAIVDQMIAMSGKGQYPSITSSDVGEIEIPLPPLEIQQQIVSEIDSYQKIVDGAKQVVNNYKPSITINPNWEMVELGEVCKIINGRNQSEVVNPNGKYPIYGSGGIMGYADDYLCEEGCTIIGRKGTINKPIYVETKFWNVDTAFGFSPNEKINSRYLYFFCCGYNFKQHDTGTTIPSLTKAELLHIEIPLPPIEEQEVIVQVIENEIQLVAANKQLITLFEAKIAAKINSVWGVSTTTNHPKPYSIPESELLVAAEKG